MQRKVIIWYVFILGKWLLGSRDRDGNRANRVRGLRATAE